MFATIDRLLRGDFHHSTESPKGRVTELLTILLVSGAIYGACMGLYVVLRAGRPQALQLPSSVLKVPLLFILTQLVTIPSLYVFATLSGARLSFRSLFEMMSAAIAMSAAVLASLGPITVFFTLSTDSHEFMVTLNVFFFAIGGIIGVNALNRSIGRLLDEEAAREAEQEAVIAKRPKPSAKAVTDSASDGATDVEKGGSDGKDGKDDRRDQDADGKNRAVESLARPAWRPRNEASRSVLRTWLVMYVVVGAQMSWIMRPFVGRPDDAFALFSPTESNFLSGFFEILGGFFG